MAATTALTTSVPVTVISSLTSRIFWGVPGFADGRFRVSAGCELGEAVYGEETNIGIRSDASRACRQR